MQRLVTAKSRLGKTNLTIPRLELVAGHMAVNLAVNVRNALEGFKMAENIHCCLDSSVALHWLNDDGQYRQFVANRVNKIRSHPNVLWRHVPTAENPADLGSRGGSVDGARLWCQGPDWLSDESRWPPKLVTKASDVGDAEKRVLREMAAVAVKASTSDNIIEKFKLCKALRILGWITRFINNCRKVSTNASGTITTDEIMKQEMVLVKQTQERAVSDVKFLEDKEQLGLAWNEDGIWECHGRIQGEYPIYLPDTALFTTKIVQRAHLSTLHGGVAMVMAKVREKYWIPRLRKLAKKVISGCYGCKKFRARPANLPNSMLFTPPTYLPELKAHYEEDLDLRKRTKFLKRTKDQMWRRWTNEYMRALRERHRLKHQAKDNNITVGDVVIIKSGDTNRNHWPLGIVERLIEGKDRVVRAVRLRSGRNRLERAIQHLYPLEISCDITRDEEAEQLNPTHLDSKARAFVPKRKAGSMRQSGFDKL